MNNSELIGQGFFFEIQQTAIVDFSEGPVVEYPKKRLMIGGNDKILASNYIVTSLMEGINNGKCLTFYRRVPALCWVSKSAPNQAQLPTFPTA